MPGGRARSQVHLPYLTAAHLPFPKTPPGWCSDLPLPADAPPVPPRPILPSLHSTADSIQASPKLGSPPIFQGRQITASLPLQPALSSSLPKAPYLISTLSHFSFVYRTYLGGGNKPSHNTATSSSYSPIRFNWHRTKFLQVFSSASSSIILLSIHSQHLPGFSTKPFRSPQSKVVLSPPYS